MNPENSLRTTRPLITDEIPSFFRPNGPLRNILSIAINAYVCRYRRSLLKRRLELGWEEFWPIATDREIARKLSYMLQSFMDLPRVVLLPEDRLALLIYDGGDTMLGISYLLKVEKTFELELDAFSIGEDTKFIELVSYVEGHRG